MLINIKDVIGVQIGDNPHGICLYPSVIRANAFIMYSNLEDDGKTYCGQDIYRMGILFGTDLTCGQGVPIKILDMKTM